MIGSVIDKVVDSKRKEKGNMSGGHWQYNQYSLVEIQEDLEDIIKNNHNEETNEWGDTKGHFFNNDVINQLKTISGLVLLAEIGIQRADWLISGDDGEEAFLNRFIEDINERGKDVVRIDDTLKFQWYKELLEHLKKIPIEEQ